MARSWISLALFFAGVASCLPASQLPLGFTIPTPYQSAVLARRIYHLSSLAVVSTTFPEQKTLARIQPPEHIEGVSIGLLEYFSPNCSAVFGDDNDVGNPLLLAVNIATYVRNSKAGSNVTLSLAWTPSGGMRPASLPRFAIMGHLEPISNEVSVKRLGECFTKTHPDAKLWLPGNDIHSSYFAKVVVDGIYWFGGYGDRAYIGWLDLNDWQSITRAEWENVRLPGELSS